MAKGCDSSWDFDYKSRVDALVDEGYTFIGRYLNHSAGVRNGLTVSEANRLSNAGVFICALYESDSGTSISHFTRSNGIADKEENIMLLPHFRANFKTGYWEAVFSHTRPLGVVPWDMRG